MPRLDELAQEASDRLLVRLAEDPFQQIISAVQGQRAQLESATGILQQTAEAAWQAAGTEIYEFVDLIVRTNVPRKPINQILARPDIQQMLRRPFEEAKAYSIEAANQAWQAGLDSGVA
jgi:3-methyladenine DNA glycosylase/8-oxoguanine DNA glycosylase